MNEEERRFKILEIVKYENKIKEESNSIKIERNYATALALGGISMLAATYYLSNNPIMMENYSWIESALISIGENPIITRCTS